MPVMTGARRLVGSLTGDWAGRRRGACAPAHDCSGTASRRATPLPIESRPTQWHLSERLQIRQSCCLVHTVSADLYMHM